MNISYLKNHTRHVPPQPSEGNPIRNIINLFNNPIQATNMLMKSTHSNFETRVNAHIIQLMNVSKSNCSDEKYQLLRSEYANRNALKDKVVNTLRSYVTNAHSPFTHHASDILLKIFVDLILRFFIRF